MLGRAGPTQPRAQPWQSGLYFVALGSRTQGLLYSRSVLCHSATATAPPDQGTGVPYALWKGYSGRRKVSLAYLELEVSVRVFCSV